MPKNSEKQLVNGDGRASLFINTGSGNSSIKHIWELNVQPMVKSYLVIPGFEP